jgi:hypothetical protein
MPRAGQIIRALDYEGYASDADSTDETNFNSTAYTLGGTTVGAAFTAPTSGRVLVMYGVRMRLNSATGVNVLLTAEIRTGAVVGSGTQIIAAADGFAVEVGQDANARIGGNRSMPVEGLTAGSVYNVSLWHRNATSVASAASIFDRTVQVVPIP